MKLYVEGGGNTNDLRTACRRGFREFLNKAGLSGHMPRIVACGSRLNAYKDYCIAIDNGEKAMLLVDSEDPVDSQSQFQPWQHLLKRKEDQWRKPSKAVDNECHLMVQCMEAWFLADRQTLKTFFGQKFLSDALPSETRGIESIAKQEVYECLARATWQCGTKGSYDKGKHSYELLRIIDSTKVIEASAWAKRFVDEVEREMRC